jgi:hypothetical protein
MVASCPLRSVSSKIPPEPREAFGEDFELLLRLL